VPDSRPSFKEIFREIPFWILLVVTIAYFYRPLFLGETFFFRDIYNHIYPQKRLFAELVLSSQLPLWDPYRHGGQPFLANMNNSVLYPSNLLYLIMPTVTALNIDIVLHIGLAALATYVLARMLGFNPFAAAASGLIYAFSGPSLSLPNIWPYAALHPPLILLFWHLFCLENNKRWFFLTVLFGAIQIFAGHPEMTAITFAILIIWTFAFPYQGNFFARIMHLLLAMIAIFATAAIQLIPMAELVQHSSRSQGIRPDTFFAWSVNPKRYPELVFPNFLGSVYSLSPGDQWGLALEELATPYILSLYFGIPALMLAVMGALNKNSTPEFPRRIRIVLLILGAFSFIAMAGRHIPGFRELIIAIPAITIFRYPVKFILLAVLPISLLAGFQLHCLIQNSELRNLRIPLAVASFIATCLGLLSIFLFVFPAMSAHFLSGYFPGGGYPALNGIRTSTLHTAAVSILFTLFLSLVSMRNQPKFNVLLCCLIGLDLMIAGSDVNHFAPREFFTDAPSLARYIKTQIEDGKLYRTPDYGSVKIRSSDSVVADRWRLEMLSNYTASMYGIAVVFHEDYDWLESKRMEALSQKMRQLPWQQRKPVLTSADVRFILTADELKLPGVHLVQVIKNSTSAPYFLYRNEGCGGQPFFVPNSLIEPDTKQILKMITSPNFDPCTTLVLEESTVGVGIHGTANAFVKLINTSANSTSHSIVTDKPGFLVFSEPSIPGWKWTIDGWTVNAVRANFAFQAVAVPAGKHQVDRIYRPASFVIGSAISLITLVSLALTSVTKKTIRVPNEIAEPI
jgi:Bacterial membrane protein YfhO